MKDYQFNTPDCLLMFGDRHMKSGDLVKLSDADVERLRTLGHTLDPVRFIVGEEATGPAPALEDSAVPGLLERAKEALETQSYDLASEVLGEAGIVPASRKKEDYMEAIKLLLDKAPDGSARPE